MIDPNFTVQVAEERGRLIRENTQLLAELSAIAEVADYYKDVAGRSLSSSGWFKRVLILIAKVKGKNS